MRSISRAKWLVAAIVVLAVAGCETVEIGPSKPVALDDIALCNHESAINRMRPYIETGDRKQKSLGHLVTAIAYADLGDTDKVEEHLPGIDTIVTGMLTVDEKRARVLRDLEYLRALRVDVLGEKATCD